MRRMIAGLALLSLAMGVTAHAERAYVTSNQVKIVDDELGQVIGGIDLGKSVVRDMVFTRDGSTAYLAHSRGIAVVDVDASAVTATWSDRAVNDLVLDEDAGLLYALQHKSGEPYEVISFALASGEVTHRHAVDNRALDLVVAGDRLMTTNLHRGTVTPYDRASGQATDAVAISATATDAELGTYIIKSLLSADGQRVYVVLNGEEAGVVILDAATGAEVDRVALGHPAYVRDAVLSPDGTRIYLAALDHLSVVDLNQRAEVAWVDLGVTHQGIDVTADGSKLFLVNPVFETAGTVAVVDTGSFEVLARIDTPEISPYRVAVIP